MNRTAIKAETQESKITKSSSAILDGWIDALVRFSETEPETLTKDGDQNSLTIRIAFNPKNDHYVKMVVCTHLSFQ